MTQSEKQLNKKFTSKQQQGKLKSLTGTLQDLNRNLEILDGVIDQAGFSSEAYAKILEMPEWKIKKGLIFLEKKKLVTTIKIGTKKKYYPDHEKISNTFKSIDIVNKII